METQLAFSELSANNAEKEKKALRGKLEAAERRADEDAALLRDKLDACERETSQTAQVGVCPVFCLCVVCRRCVHP